MGDDFLGDSRFVRSARAGRNDDPLWVQPLDFIEHSLLAKRSSAAASTISQARAIATFGTVFSVAVALFVAVYLSYTVGSSIAELASVADELAQGGLQRRAVWVHLQQGAGAAGPA
jgi:hypothetical protein